MNWKTAIQLSVAAIVGAGIFEAGRVTALREYVRGENAEATEDTPAEVAYIAEQKPPVVRVPQKAEPEAPAEAEKPTGRKKYADPPLAPKDRELVAATERIVADEDLSAALALAPKVPDTARREVREAMVAMLAWFGKKTIAELTPYLADKDEGVAMEASAHWKRVFANECDDGERLRMAALAMNRLTSETMLDELGVEDIFNDVEDEAAAVETIISVIKNGNPAGVKFAKSAYDTLTGETWKDEDAARAWVRENAADA